MHDRSKHIDIKYQMIMDNVQKGYFELDYVPTKEMVADLFTSSLPAVTHEHFVSRLGMKGTKEVSPSGSVALK